MGKRRWWVWAASPVGCKEQQKKVSLLFKAGPYLPLKICSFLSTASYLRMAYCHHPRHAAEVWSCARLTLLLWLLRRSKPDIWSSPSFNECLDWGCRRRSVAGRCVETAPMLGKEAMLLALSTDCPSVTGGVLTLPRGLIFHSTRHHLCSKGYRRRWVMYQCQAKRLWANSLMLLIFREKTQPASRLWEEVFLQRVMDDKNLGCHPGPLT